MSVLNNGCVHAAIPNASQDIIIGAIIVAARWARIGSGGALAFLMEDRSHFCAAKL